MLNIRKQYEVILEQIHFPNHFFCSAIICPFFNHLINCSPLNHMRWKRAKTVSDTNFTHLSHPHYFKFKFHKTFTQPTQLLSQTTTGWIWRYIYNIFTYPSHRGNIFKNYRVVMRKRLGRSISSADKEHVFNITEILKIILISRIID